jgi:ATP-dependent RNA helicase RhlE
VNLSQVQFLVLDEADRMLDLGFIDDIRKVAEYLPAKRQTLLFSATYSPDIKQLADDLLDKPRHIEVARRSITADAVTQAVYRVEKSRKREMLSFLISRGKWNQVLVFARTRYGADKLTEELLYDGIKAAAIHSNKSQSIRNRTLAQFKAGEFRVLVATDVAARGLDIEHLPHVVNYDLPQVPEDYVHRIGRTGRAGKEGIAVSLVSNEELGLLKAIEKLLKFSIPQQELAEFPQYAARRTGANKIKSDKGAAKARKRPAKRPQQGTAPAKQAKDPAKQVSAQPKQAKAPVKQAKAAPTGRKKVMAERPAPKLGRRKSRER